MTSLLCWLSLLASLSVLPAFADVDPSWPTPPPPNVTLERIKPIDVVWKVPQTAWNYLKFSFQRDSVPVWSGIIASTALLYQYDEDILKWSQGQGRRWNLGNEDKTKTVIEMGPYPLLRLPSDVGSGLYFLGDGWTHFGVAGGFALYGHTKDNTRAWNTGMEIIHGMIVSTIFNQAIKRSTGHETPSQRTEPRGKWRPFPDTPEYSKNTAKYDAMPSGHIMTATMMFTTIHLNYPEYSAYIWPVQIVWSAALMFQMVNNGVHWASDYPLGIAMGWAAAKVAVRMGEHNKEQEKAKPSETGWMFFPAVGPAGDPMAMAMLRF